MFEFVARMTLGLVFFVAGAAKAVDLSRFQSVLSELGISASLSGPTALALVAYELMLAGLFWSGSIALVTTLLAIALLTVFAGVSVKVLRSGEAIECGCFGPREKTLGGETLFRALVLIVLTALYYVAHAERGGTTWWPISLDRAVLALTLVAAVIVGSRWIARGARRLGARPRFESRGVVGGDADVD
jgi:uncharacterized membrane protein YfbV (UPF0208 family)